MGCFRKGAKTPDESGNYIRRVEGKYILTNPFRFLIIEAFMF